MSVVWLSLWRGLQTSPGERIPFSEIVATVAEKHRLSVEEIHGRSCKREIALARQEVCWLARRHTSLSLTAIGNRLNRHHTTVLAAIRRHEDRLKMEKAA